jgi:serine/threonine-protein kinase
VRRLGDQVRINAQLIKAADGSALWSQRYDRPYRDLFKLQDDITAAVATALRTELLAPDEAQRQGDRPPSGNLDAYNAALQGKFLAGRLTVDDLHRAITYYDEAVRLDPRFARAWAGKVYAAINLGQLSHGEERAQLFAAARASSERALALDPGLSLALRAHSYVLSNLDLDFTAALAASRRAYELAPHDPNAAGNYASDLVNIGRFDEAIAIYRQALAVDPLRMLIYSNLSGTLAAVDQLDEAERLARKAVELAPANPYAQESLAYIMLLRGDADAVLRWADKEPDPMAKLWYQALAWHTRGDTGKADRALKELVDGYTEDAAYYIAEVYGWRGQPDEMFRWLDRAWTQRDYAVSGVLADRMLLRYKGDPRFAAFCRRIGVPVPDTTVASATPPTAAAAVKSAP